MRVLVTAASRHEATGEIAAALTAGLLARGIDAELRPIGEIAEVGAYDAIVLGSAVYVGRWLREARQFAERNGPTLAGKPVWLFSSGPVGTAGAAAPMPADAATLAQLTGARGHRVFPGRLERRRLGPVERVAAAMVRAREGDERDWRAVDRFAAEIAAALAADDPPDTVAA